MKFRQAFTNISERTLRITAASVLAVVMMSASYVLSGPNFLTSRSVNAESTEELLKAFASKDTDSDGLPDWEEALYGTDPNKAVSNTFGIPDGQAAQEGKLTPNALASQLPDANQGTTTPLTDTDFGGTPAPAAGSITEQFAQEFLQQITTASNGRPLDAATKDALVTRLLAQFTAKAASSLTSRYAPVSVHTNTSISFKQYVGSLEDILTAYSIPEGDRNPLELMESLIQNDDEGARKKLKTVSASYREIAARLRSMSVPPSQVQSHVALVKSFEELSSSTSIASSFEKDPLATIGSLSVYSHASSVLGSTISSIATSLLQSGEPQPDQPGFFIVGVARLNK